MKERKKELETGDGSKKAKSSSFQIEGLSLSVTIQHFLLPFFLFLKKTSLSLSFLSFTLSQFPCPIPFSSKFRCYHLTNYFVRVCLRYSRYWRCV